MVIECSMAERCVAIEILYVQAPCGERRGTESNLINKWVKATIELHPLLYLTTYLLVDPCIMVHQICQSFQMAYLCSDMDGKQAIVIGGMEVIGKHI